MVKPKFLSSDYTTKSAILVDYFDDPHFPNPLHYHKSLELAYIISGYGVRYIGNHIETFNPGDLVLVGEELTHVWKSDDDFYEEGTELRTKAVVIKFHSNFAGDDFFRLRESYPIQKTIDDALGGLRVTGSTNGVIKKILLKMLTQSPIEQILSLLEILNIISKSDDVIILSQFDLHKSKNPKEKDRMNRVVQYSMQNFGRQISLDEIAEIANLSKSAFCRYFKNSVKKSYSEYLYQIRVDYACRLLSEKNMSITEVCYDSGFNNPSAFSQIFKKYRGVTPKKYRDTHLIK